MPDRLLRSAVRAPRPIGTSGPRALRPQEPARRLWRAYEYVAFYALLALFGISCLLWSVPVLLLYPVLPARLGQPLGQFLMMAGFRYFLGAMRLARVLRSDLRALDSLRDGPALVIAPNHPSLLDAVLVISRLPRVVCAAKGAVWDNVFLGAGARLAGFIRNDSPARLIRGAAQQLRAGRHFLVFPEGTRTAAGTIGEFKGGFALIAKAAGVPIQTVFIDSNSRFLGKGWPLFKKPEFPLVYRFRLGRRFIVEGDVHAVVRELEAYYREELGGRDA